MDIIKGRKFSYEEVELLAHELDSHMNVPNFHIFTLKKFGRKKRNKPQLLRAFLLDLYGTKSKKSVDLVMKLTKRPLSEMPLYVTDERDYLIRVAAKWRLKIGK